MSGPAPLPAGARVGSLRIDRVLGQGAFGVTYLATDTNSGKSCALKEYLPKALAHRGDGSQVAAVPGRQQAFDAGRVAFLEEAKTGRRLDHPNLVKVEDCFEANGTAYLRMPFLGGEPLHVLLQRGGTLDPEEARALTRPLLDALGYLHRQGIVHRDVKPANILVTPEGKPVLLDLGSAAPAEGSAHGSEGYAAPEQSGPGTTPGPAADLYALAATLYRCITGQIPPPASERQAARREGRPDPLEALSARVPPLAFGQQPAVIDRALALDPRSRPGSAAEWRRALDEVEARPAADGHADEREWLPMVLLGIFVVVMAAALTYLFWPGAENDTGAAPNEPQSQAPYRSPEEEARWRAALESDTAYGYRQFVADYPDSIHNDQARVHLERLDHQAWGQANAEGTRVAVEDYLDRFPDGLHRADADLLLNEFRLAEESERRRQAEQDRQDDAAWETARRARTTAAVNAYLEAWPTGRHVDAARELAAGLQAEREDARAFEAARKLDTRAAYQAYLDAFPRGDHVAAALEAIDDLTLRPGKVFRDCPDCPSMVVVPAGTFWQGADENDPMVLKKETPKRMVTFAEPFAIGVFEVTFAQWDRCVEAGGCTTRPSDNGWGRGDRPVIMVSWNDAQEYVDWLSGHTGQRYALPSESQWEYAARAGEEGDWPGGDPSLVCQFANVAGSESGFRWQHDACADDVAMQTLPVGSLRANAFGLHDTIGNVAEWTLDCMNLSYLDAPADGSAWNRGICSSRMTRGGSWFTGSREIRLPARFNLKNGDRNDFTGFRVVRVVDE